MRTRGPARARSRGARTALRLAAAAAALPLLAATACAPGTGGGEEGGDGDVTLTVWSWRPEDAAGYERIFDVYEEQHPGVTVEFEGHQNTEYPAILQTGLTRSSGGPDVVQLKPYGPIQAFIGAGQLVPLDDHVDLSDWAPEVVDSARGREDGGLYGVPFAVQTLHVLYNPAIFAEHDLAPPETWEDMVAAAETLQEAGVIPFATSAQEPWVLAILREVFGATRTGGEEFAQRVLTGETDFTDPDYVGALEVTAGLEPFFPEDSTAVSYTDAQTLFTSGEAAMYPGGAYELAPFQQANPELEIAFFDAPPAPDAAVDHALTPGFSDGSYGVNAASANQEAAIELVQWMATEEFGQLFSDELRQISTVPGVTPADPLLADMSAAYADHGTPYMMSVHFGYGDPLGRDAEGQALADMILGNATGEEAGERVQEEISAWFEPSR
ncbi:ABC transporter substrate-binding protein [Allonocardiopsis opalescens]|uniref:Carbohydrate ABC transporter substrate-binding protein (CUT1 family) n=1 Tax=Allonocardiopsis opalescens TaxID=1144618 RepID=A0A2T0PVX6_9ACTN|nr:extracellular solute-binding protein [Allonocardiopsis opalescens]PRX95695.1 carbohydrate ABC transporter substrate-binding protein (CUT1 family) [Allonocardiopsis opalescens]